MARTKQTARVSTPSVKKQIAVYTQATRKNQNNGSSEEPSESEETSPQPIQNESNNASLIEDAAMEDDEKESQPPAKKVRFEDDKASLKWYEIMSDEKFADLVLISSDKVQISSHRNVLSKYSPVFADLIDKETELPVTINVDNFDTATIQAALGFLYDKTDAIDGKETAVFKFALHYDIKDLIDACCSFFEKSVDPANVCEYIQIAYNQNFEELKKKCLKVLVEKKKEIDASKWNDLPKNIIIEAFCL
uniref:BTB domain-containing protein n=1 Tax=Panagrolaimus sp. ES5 TaxID=591445 RepID=A0AC34GXE8_9BILA